MPGIAAHSRRALLALGAVAAAAPWRAGAARPKKPKPLVYAVATITETRGVGTGGGPPVFWAKAIGDSVKPSPDGGPGPAAALDVDAYYSVVLSAAESRAAIAQAVAEQAADLHGVPTARVQVVIH